VVRISNKDLLRILQQNSRTPFIEIARRLKVTETAVRKKVKKLQEEGVIRRFTIEIDPKKIGFAVQAIIGVDTKPEKYIPAIEKMKNMEEVLSLYSSSGDHMILMECWFKDTEELRKFLKKLESIDGVTRICPAIILEKIK